jgi:hypothetical protein
LSTIPYPSYRKKYHAAVRWKKSHILKTFTVQTGYNHKYAIHILANEGKMVWAGKGLGLKASQKIRKKRVYKRVYDEAVKKALVPIWIAFNFQYGKLLSPFLRLNITRITRTPRFACSAAVPNPSPPPPPESPRPRHDPL